MALLEIKKYPDQVLKKKTEFVPEINTKISELISDMKDTLIKQGGLGLAAPQIGESKKIIIIQFNKIFKAFINPRIVKKTKETDTIEEGCLSFPNLFLNIKRPKGVVVEALNEEGKMVQLEAVGLTARILQHEIEHLEGKLFIDKISFWQRLKVLKEFRK
jgi:peptide deformylase